MKMHSHLSPVTKRPCAAQISNLQVKLEGITEMVDLVLLADRQSAFKTTFRFEEGTDDGDGGGGDNNNGGGLGDIEI